MGNVGPGSKPSNIFERLLEGDFYPRFIQLLETAGLKEELLLLKGGPYTVLAPSDDAIDNSSPEKIEEFNKALNNPELARKLVERYIIPGELKIHEIAEKGKVKAKNGEELNVEYTCKIKEDYDIEMDFESGIVTVKINGAKVQHANTPCSNGIIHVIDRLI